MADSIYYYALKAEARERVQKSLNSRILREAGSLPIFDKMTLSSIASPGTPDALAYARDVWPQFYDPAGWNGFGVSWHDIVLPRLRDRDMFDLAIWQEVDGEQVLAALALGNPSNGRTHLTLKWLERFMGHTHVSGRVAFITLACAEEYAKLLGCQRVLIKDPLVPQLYERYGYSAYRHPYVRHGGNYMSKELAHDQC